MYTILVSNVSLKLSTELTRAVRCNILKKYTRLKYTLVDRNDQRLKTFQLYYDKNNGSCDTIRND